jgi:hypothetical protein
VLALLLPLAVPLVAPVSIARAVNGDGDGDEGLCVGIGFFPVEDLEVDLFGLASGPEVLSTLSLPAGVGQVMLVLAADSAEAECPVSDPSGPPEEFTAFIPGVSLPRDADDEVIPFVTEVDLLGSTFDPDSDEFAPVPWEALWTEDGAPAVDGPGTDLKLLNEGVTLEGPMELVVPPDDALGSTSSAAALLVPFIVSAELAWEDLRLDVRLIDLDGSGELEEFADVTVGGLTVRGDLCLVASFVTGFDPDEPGRPSGDEVFGVATALEPGDEVLLQFGVIRDDIEGPGASFCDALGGALDSEEPGLAIRKIAAQHVPPTLDLMLFTALTLSRTGDDGQETPWIELMATLDVIGPDPDDETTFVIDDLDAPTDPDADPDDDDGPPTSVTILTEAAGGGMWESVLLFTVQDDAAPGEYLIDLFAFAVLASDDGRGFGPGGGPPFAYVLAGDGDGFVEEGLGDGFFAGAESDPMRLTIEVLGDDDADGVAGEGGGSGGDGGGSGEVVEGDGEADGDGDVEGSVSCSAPVAGAGVTCTLTSVPERTFTWEASTNPVFASGEVTTDASGSGVFTFPIPASLLGETILVDVLGVAGSGGPIGTVAAAPAAAADGAAVDDAADGAVADDAADGPVPTSVPAGEGPVATHGHVGLLGAVALMVALMGVVVLLGAVPSRPVPSGPAPLSLAPAAPLRRRRATRSGGCPAS